jgi:hypothetical protein
MADFYPLLSKAVAGLDPDAPGDGRRAVYEQARTALLRQLRTLDPPFSEAEIKRERLALEEAVQRVEGEAAQRARDAHALGDLVSEVDDPGKAPLMVAAGGATGRLTRVWRFPTHVLVPRA